MNEQTIEKLAEMLGTCAATGDSRELVKQAGAEQLLLPLMAAGAGGAAGYFGTEKEKNKTRNAIYGALTGGLGGAGLQAASPVIKDVLQGNSDRVDLGGLAGPGSSGGLLGNIGAGLATAGDWATAPIRSWSRVFGGAAGVGAANAPVARLGGDSLATRAEKGLTGLYERVTGKNKLTGELNTALTEGKIKPFGSGKNKSDPARLLRAILEQNPNNPTVKAIQRDGNFGADDLTRRGRLLYLDRAAAKSRLEKLPPDFLDQLAKSHSGPAGRTWAGRIGRHGTNIGAGYAGSILTDLLMRYGYNLVNGPPAAE